MTLNSGGGTIQVDNASTNLTLAGPLSGSGGLTKAGPGTLTFAGSNDYAYTGQVLLTSGALAIRSPVPAGPGLYEGLVSNNHWEDTTDPIPLTSIQPVAQWGASTYSATNSSGNNIYPNWANETTWGYSGYLDNKSGGPITYTFGKNFDDAAFLTIDGVSVINNTVYNQNATGSVTLRRGSTASICGSVRAWAALGPTPAHSTTSAFPTTPLASPPRAVPRGCKWARAIPTLSSMPPSRACRTRRW